MTCCSDKFSSSYKNYQGGTFIYNGTQKVEFRKCSGGLGCSYGIVDTFILNMKLSKCGREVIKWDTKKGGNGGKIQYMGTYQYLSSANLCCLVFQIIVVKKMCDLSS